MRAICWWLTFFSLASGRFAFGKDPPLGTGASTTSNLQLTDKKNGTENNDADMSAETIKKLSASVEILGKNLTVVTGNEQIKIVLGGVVSADFYYNHARPVAPGIPFFLVPRSPLGFSQDTFDANARQTTLFGIVSGPKIGDFETSGFVALCLFNDALIVDRYGICRCRRTPK
jgi:hypothetical protein